MKKRLLRRFIFAYIIFCMIGFIGTSYLTSRNHSPFLQVTLTLSDLREYFSTGYYLIYIIVCLAALLVLFVYIFNIYRSIHRIVGQATAYAEGDYETPTPDHAQDELGFISDVMGGMALELSSLEEDQRKFVSNVSHDFRSPLTSIKGYAEAMSDGTIPVEMQGKYLNIIISETERLEKLTQSLLDLNKYSAKGAYIDYSAFDLNDVIRQTVLTFEGRVKDKNITFLLKLSGSSLYVKTDVSSAACRTVPANSTPTLYMKTDASSTADQSDPTNSVPSLYVRADSAKIEQVLHNLIDNAVKFSNENSEIIIETTTKNGKAFVSIKDSGIGIPRDSLNKIWERFYKTDLSRGKDRRGTGLGLSIVKEIIHAHHENINVISTEGVGTEFIFSLSLTDP
ncbi:MAG: HAMP domain-containing histidine kinase [Clostridiales bacterium]|nr:HAMP domain-containing histidine kinase [Clostridiales bacterium]